MSFSHPKSCSNRFLPLLPLFLPFSLEDSFILSKSSESRSAEKSSTLTGTFAAVENTEQMGRVRARHSQRKGLALVKPARLKHRDRNLNLETEQKALSPSLSSLFSPSFLFYQTVPRTVIEIRPARPCSPWKVEWRRYKWSCTFRMLKAPIPRMKGLKISFTNSAYSLHEFKHSKALFLVTYKSTIFFWQASGRTLPRRRCSQVVSLKCHDSLVEPLWEAVRYA